MPTLAENIARNNQFHSDLRDLITENGGTIPADTPCEDLLPILVNLMSGLRFTPDFYTAQEGWINFNQYTIQGDYELVLPESDPTTGIPYTGIWAECFMNNQIITKVTIPSGYTDIGSGAFNSCLRLKEVVIPQSVSLLGTDVFNTCSELDNVKLTGNITKIDERDFFGCINLTNIELPASITNIQGDAFALCNNLTDVYYRGSRAQWKNIEIQAGNEALSTATIHYDYAGQ